MEKLNKQALLEKFSKVLDRAEEIQQWEEFKEYQTRVEELEASGKEVKQEDVIPYLTKLWGKVNFENRVSSTALMIAIAGNNWL